MKRGPKRPLPQPLRGSQPDSFAEDTMRNRLPSQALRVIEDNSFSAEINQSLRELYHDLPDGVLRPLTDRRDGWDTLGQDVFGQSWLDAPWLFAEIYFYHRLLEASQFFQNDVDIFALQKQQAWASEADQIEQITAALMTTLHEPAAVGLPKWLAQALWGNQADLGLFPVGTARPETQAADRQAATLVDDTERVLDYVLANAPLPRIDFVLDNAGLEFVGDLCLMNYLLSNHLVTEVVLHAKRVPFFISDVMLRDVGWTLTTLRQHANSQTAQMGEFCAAHLASGRVTLRADAHWVDGLAHWQMDDALYADLAQSSLIISKGDLNYRRWLGDLNWPYDTPFADIVSYSPAPLLCLRTCKAPLGSGISAETTARLFATVPGWNTSGRYGVIQFYQPE